MVKKIKQSKGLTVPYRDRSDVKKAVEHLRTKCDPVYVLIFKTSVSTGLRISDVLGLRWDNLVNGRLELNESKGTKASISRAKNRVLKRAKETLLATTTETDMIAKFIATKPKDILPLLNDAHRVLVEEELKEAEKKAKPKTRECVLPSPLVRYLKDWKRKNKGKDGGYLFPANLIRYAKSKTPKPISRQSAWAVFSKIGEACNFDFNTSCHQLRKTFAVFLYEATGHDSQLVIKEVGWENDNYLKRYLAVEKDKCNSAVKQMQEDFLR